MYHNPPTDLLDEHDYERVRIDASLGFALSGPLVDGPKGRKVSWASYNQWLCFPARDINISYMEENYGEVRKVPTLHVTESAHYFEFSMDPEPVPDCDKITRRWRALLENEEAFCVYAAPLQELDISSYDTTAETGSL